MQLMGPRRHQTLVKAAEAVFDYVGQGDTPTAALSKSAKEHDLNAKEVALVSNTVNNASTLSHLAESEPDEKGAPFALSNADAVIGELFPDLEGKQTLNDPEPGKKPEGEDVESPISLDPQDQKAKTARERAPRAPTLADPESYIDSGVYHDVMDDGLHHVKVAAEAFATGFVEPEVRTTLDVGLDGITSARDVHGNPKYADEYAGRLVGNPYTHIRKLEKTADEARTRYSAARDAAFTKLAGVIETFRRTDSPSFARVETLAKHAGVDPGTVDVVWVSGDLDRVGHRRGGQAKIAGATVTCSPHEKTALDGIVELERLWKHAAHCAAAKSEVDERVQALSADLAKIAADTDASGAIKTLTSSIDTLPGEILGQGQDVIGDPFGTQSDSPEEYSDAKSPMPTGSRQRISNSAAGADFASLLDDEYIAARPITDIVQAYNAAIGSTSKQLPPSMIRRLVKEQLATGEDLDVQTLVNLNKDKERGAS